MKKKVIVPIYKNHDPSVLLGTVSINEDVLSELPESYLGAEWITNEDGQGVKELLAFSLSPVSAMFKGGGHVAPHPEK